VFMNSIDFSKFYLLDDPFSNIALRIEMDEFSRYHEKLFTGEITAPKPILMKGYMGGPPKDFLWGGGNHVCVSKKVIDILESGYFTGWATYPVEVYDRKDRLLKGYYGLIVKPFVGKWIFQPESIVDKPPRVPGAEPWKAYIGVSFDANLWDGSDICRIQRTHLIVTQRLYQTLAKEKVTNIELTRMMEAEFDVLSVTPVS